MDTLSIAEKKSVLFRFPVFRKIDSIILLISVSIFLSCHTLTSESALYPEDRDLIFMDSSVDNRFLSEFLSLHLVNSTGKEGADEILEQLVDNAVITIVKEPENQTVYFYAFLFGDWSPFLMNWVFNANPEWEYESQTRILRNYLTGDEILFPNKDVLIFRKKLNLEIIPESNLIQIADYSRAMPQNETTVTFFSPVFLKEILQVENDFPFTQLSCSLKIDNDHKVVIDGIFQTESLIDSRACSIAFKFFLISLEKNHASLLGDDIRNVQISVGEGSADFNGLTLHSAEEALYFLYSFKKEQDW